MPSALREPAGAAAEDGVAPPSSPARLHRLGAGQRLQSADQNRPRLALRPGNDVHAPVNAVAQIHV